jgi:hypothetical protein
LFSVDFGRFRGMVCGVMNVPLCGVCVVRRCFVVSGVVVSGGLAMMTGRMIVMFGSFVMMFRSLLGHFPS